jgi:hypothetical protein
VAPPQWPCALAAAAGIVTMRRMSASTIDVACLCAAWCRLCDDYRAVIALVRSELEQGADTPLRWHWIDIEDEAELVGDFDVETFPTLVIVDDQQVRFAGAIEPQPDTLRRLLRANISEAAPDWRWPAAPREVVAFAERLRAAGAAARWVRSDPAQARDC